MALSLGELFPAGGPVAPEMIIGRRGEVQDVSQRVREGLSMLLEGPRRIGKTTLGDAICDELSSELIVLPRIEVPDAREDCAELRRALVRSYHAVSFTDEAGALARATRPLLGALLKRAGLPTDLSELGRRDDLSSREILELPTHLAAETGHRVLVFFDELQRIAAAVDRDEFLIDLTDLYAGNPDVVILVDGSEDRLLGEILHAPGQLEKLLTRVPVSPHIPLQDWRPALLERFTQAGHPITRERLERLLEFGAERPYETMLVCRETAMSARATATTGGADVSDFDVDQGIAAARRLVEL